VAAVAGWVVIGVSAATLVVVAFALRPRLRQVVTTLIVAVCGAGVGVGGLLLLHDVGVTSWILTPLVLAAAAAAHVRFFFRGEGPFRT
jgi:hypothetical protein